MLQAEYRVRSEAHFLAQWEGFVIHSIDRPLLQKNVNRLRIQVYQNREEMGKAVARAAAVQIRDLLADGRDIRAIFAAAPSQNEFLQALVEEPDIDWKRITVFQMDEYVGLSPDAPQSFSSYLRSHIFNQVQPKQFHVLDGMRPSREEGLRYGELLGKELIDLVFLGIGENGHIAFNDPSVADFHDPQSIKKVELDSVCRRQQVNDGCFERLEQVPGRAMTLTVPTLMSGRSLFCIVPGVSKRDAVYRTLNDPVSEACPSTILRTHQDCVLFTDIDAYGKCQDLQIPRSFGY